MAFAIVRFEDKTTAVVPVSWIHKGQCFWPPKNLQHKILPQVSKGLPPSKEWPKHLILSSHLFSSYNDASRKLSKLEDLNTTAKRVLRKRRKRRVSSTESSSEDEISKDAQRFITNEPTAVVLHACQQSSDQDDQEDETLSLTVQECAMDVKSEYLVSGPSADTFTGADKVLLSELAILKANQRSILENQEAIIRMLTNQKKLAVCDSQEETVSAWLKKLPIGHADQLQEVEKELLNEASFSDLVQLLKKVGGGSCNHFIKFVMRKLITDEFASTFSFLGVRGKARFKSLNICKAAMCAVRTHNVWGNTTESETEKLMKEWLRHASGRVKNSLAHKAK